MRDRSGHRFEDFRIERHVILGQQRRHAQDRQSHVGLQEVI
jgi:hypothetical protein